MDSLFIMRRYWGSDGEDNDGRNESVSDSDASNEHVCKKRKLDSSVKENGSHSSNKEEVINVDNESNKYVVCKKKKLDSSFKENGCRSSNKQQVINVDNEHPVCKKKKIDSSVKENRDCSSNKQEVINVGSSDEEDIIIEKTVSDGNLSFKYFDNIDSSKSSEIIKTVNGSNLLIKECFNNGGSSKDKEIITEKNVNLDQTVDVERKIQSKKIKKVKSQEIEIQESISEELNETNVSSDVGNFSTIGQIQHEKAVKVRQALPYWLSNPTYIGVNLLEEETPVSELNYLDSNTKKNLEEAGINRLFPVQLEVIPWLMQSKEQSLLVRPSDICVSAPTGSGKTLAFVLPIVQSLKNRVVCAIRALVVLPVNELAVQVYKVFETYVRGTDLKVALLTGQKSFIAEQNALIKSNGQKVQSLVDIVVTTPGRIYDHINRTKGFCLKHLRYLVIDEADRMLGEIQQGWLKQVEDAVFNDCNFPNCVCLSQKRVSYESSSAYNFGLISQPLQKLLYSATLTHDPELLHSLALYKPKLFTATSSSSCSDVPTETCVIPPGLAAFQIVCDAGTKPMIICQFIKNQSFKRILCFTETVERAHRLHLVLEEMGLFQVREISSFNRAIQRKIVLEQFSLGKVNILVCSDLVARGIDIEDIDCVISYDVPQTIKIYIHRIGRTARAGKTGTALTLLTDGEIPRFKKMLESVGIQMPEKINMKSEDLKPLVNCYQTALTTADAKLKNEKNQLSNRPVKKMNRKRK